jgi:hypothetical protein
MVWPIIRINPVPNEMVLVPNEITIDDVHISFWSGLSTAGIYPCVIRALWVHWHLNGYFPFGGNGMAWRTKLSLSKQGSRWARCEHLSFAPLIALLVLSPFHFSPLLKCNTQSSCSPPCYPSIWLHGALGTRAAGPPSWCNRQLYWLRLGGGSGGSNYLTKHPQAIFFIFFLFSKTSVLFFVLYFIVIRL